MLIGFILLFNFIGLGFCEQFLWFENEPDINDPCTLEVIGGNKGELVCHHLPVTCTDHGGFIHWANYGRVWLYLYIDPEKKQEFELCLTSGSAERTYIWYDYAQQHWEPMVHDAWFGYAARKDACKKSINGTMNLFFEAPWWFVNYVAYVSWNITKIEDYQPKPWPPVKKTAQDKTYDDVDKGAGDFAPEYIKKKKEEKEKEEQEAKKKGKKKRRKRKNKGEKEPESKEEENIDGKKERPKPAWK